MFNNKGQVGETMTWMVATIIIIVILIISVIIVTSNPFKGMREFKLSGENDLLVTKSLTGYLLTDNIYSQLTFGDSSDMNEKFLKKIFESLYVGGYSFIWLVTDSRNIDFTIDTAFVLEGTTPLQVIKDVHVSEKIKLKEDEYLKFSGIKKRYVK